MSSILTNTSAMTALQTLKSINSSLERTQGEISTGKSVATAKDNSAVWAISKVMESDVSGFNSVSDSLATGQAMVGVARTATESITDLLDSIKTKVVAAQDPSADTGKLQNETDQLIQQVNSILDAAQFNGVNLINNGTDQSVLGSLNRSNGDVTAATITVAAQNLDTAPAAAATATLADGGGTQTFTVGTTADDAASVVALAGGDAAIDLDAIAEGETVRVTIGDQNFSYTVTADDAAAGNDANDIALTNIRSQINAAGITGLTADYDPASPGVLSFNNAGTGAADTAITVRVSAAGTGGLSGLGDGVSTRLDVTSATALADIESMISTSIDAAAAFGSIESRLETQSNFVSNLTDALKSGIGALVDADMEAASARLQALQVQQQLGTQALSIANQSPQNLLSLFR
ncbi:flagellin [Rhodovulum marinum]|uniref:Flagellin n=1 Tax=Rhodovulum marinum TaxID=320662 RepID=A0A4V2SQI2_9RHOB|nr:flagellin [Rhodovulum marinum]TCP39116.1 flagellin [Rhodovulum marinum]